MNRRNPSLSEKSRGYAFTLPAKEPRGQGSGQRAYLDAIVQQAPGDVLSSVTEGASHERLVRVRQHVQFPCRSTNLEKSKAFDQRQVSLPINGELR